MIELPEAIVISRQLNDILVDKSISKAIRGQTPHKFAFTGEYDNQEFGDILKGKCFVKSWPHGNIILLQFDTDYVLTLGCGGEQILYHKSAETLPKKHQLLFEFQDGSYLSVTISGWGEIRLLKVQDLHMHPHMSYGRVDPLSDTFSLIRFEKLISEIGIKSTSVKKFIITEPGLNGMGNGVIQDILFHSNVHPKREIRTLSINEQRTLYEVLREDLQNMVRLGGRDTVKDIFGNKGRYHVLMNSKNVNTPCPQCMNLIQKQQYLGGSIYFCPSCQKINKN